MEQSDREIISLVLAGNTDAFGLLVDRYKNLVYSIGLKLMQDANDAEEMAQRAYIKAFQSLKRYNGKASFSTWLYRITYNCCLDELKRKGRQVEVVEDIGEVKNAEQSIIQDEHDQGIRLAIKTLSQEEQLLILLFYYEDKSIKELATIFGWSLSNVKVKLHRTRERLKKQLTLWKYHE